MRDEIGGVHYWRAGELRNNVMRSVQSIRTVADEITAAQATGANGRIADFDNSTSQVFLASSRGLYNGLSSPTAAVSAVPAVDEKDWVGEPDLCKAP